MARFIGFLMLATAIFFAQMAYIRIDVQAQLTALNIDRPLFTIEILIIIIGGVIFPLAMAGLLLKKK